MSTVQYSGTTRERLVTATAATADANGAISLRVGPCPLGFVWQGSVTLTGAPSGALFNAAVASTPWGQWAGPTNFGPVQLWGNETLVVTGVGLQKNTQYSMLFFGVAMPERIAEPLPPVAPLSTVTVETSTLLVSGQTMNTVQWNTGIIIQPPSLTRRLTIAINNGIDTIFPVVVGVQSGITYFSAGQVNIGSKKLYYVAIEPTIDQTYVVGGSGGSTGTLQMWITANTTSPLIVGEADQPLIIAQPVTVTGLAPSGSLYPVQVIGQVDQIQRTILNVGNNQVLIGAPGLGTSLLIQCLEIHNAGGGGGNAFFHPSGGALGFCFLSLDNLRVGGIRDVITYPLGIKLGNNLQLQVDVATGTLDIAVTFAVIKQ